MEDTDQIYSVIIVIGGGIGTIATFIAEIIIAVPIFGILVGIGLTFFVQSRTQRRAWKRDFTLKNIDLIYGPLFNESLIIEEGITNIDNSRHYFHLEKSEWEKIRNSYYFHMIEDEKFRKDLDDFYVLIELYNELAHSSYIKVKEIIKNRGSKFYKLDVDKVNFVYETESGGSSVETEECLLFGINPKDANERKTEKPMIKVVYKEKNTYPFLEKRTSHDMKEFDELWKTMLDDVSKENDIQQMKPMLIKIHTENIKLRQKLVKRINLRHKL